MTDKVQVPDPEPTQRNRYFTGKFMTARDFELDAEYFYGLHRRHNRLLHDAGVQDGFTVLHHEDKKCWSRWVRIEPGVAIDVFGRDLVSGVEEFREVPETESVLCVGYHRSAVEPIPPVSTAPASSPRTEMNRWQDGVFFTWRSGDWEEGLVPLASVMRGEHGQPCRIRSVVPVEPFGRDSGQALTRVRAISWAHGKTGQLDRGQVKVWFTRSLHQELHGISPHTFRVRVTKRASGEVVSALSDSFAALSSDGLAAVFSGIRATDGDWVHVSLLCDFILDENEVPVDGNHLRGRLPSGNGTAGGTFESWFRVEGGT